MTTCHVFANSVPTMGTQFVLRPTLVELVWTYKRQPTYSKPHEKSIVVPPLLTALVRTGDGGTMARSVPLTVRLLVSEVRAGGAAAPLTRKKPPVMVPPLG